MIEANKYIILIRDYFSYLITEFNLNSVKETINGNAFQEVSFTNSNIAVSVSYENIEDYFQVIVYRLKGKIMPEYDDKNNALHLDALNRNVFQKVTTEDITLNKEYFSKFNPSDQFQKKLLKSAKDLRLCLKYLDLK